MTYQVSLVFINILNIGKNSFSYRNDRNFPNYQNMGHSFSQSSTSFFSDDANSKKNLNLNPNLNLSKNLHGNLTEKSIINSKSKLNVNMNMNTNVNFSMNVRRKLIMSNEMNANATWTPISNIQLALLRDAMFCILCSPSSSSSSSTSSTYLEQVYSIIVLIIWNIQVRTCRKVYHNIL